MTSAGEPRASVAPWQQGRWLALGELALVVAFAVADLSGAIPLSKTPFLLALGWLSLRLRGLGWRSVGFARPRNWTQALALGSLAGIAMELLSTFVTVPFWSRLTGQPPELSGFRPLVGNLQQLLVWQVANWPLAAFGEELVYRGYLMNRIAGLAGPNGGTQGSWLLSLVAVSVFFGWAHEYQRLSGMLQEGFNGLLLGLLYLGFGRNLTVPIVAHGVSNALAFALIYFDRYPGV